MAFRHMGFVAGLAVAGWAGATQAQAPTRVGLLECDISGGTGFVITSSRALDCAFTPDGVGAPTERYLGTVQRFGLDIGFTGPGKLVWGVLAPTAQMAPGALAGSYGGVAASATIGAGAGANLLVGGSARTTSLQPLSLQGQTGVNVAAGVGQIMLEYAPPAGAKVRK